MQQSRIIRIKKGMRIECSETSTFRIRYPYVGLHIQTRSRRTCHKSTIQASTPSAQEYPLLHSHHRFPLQKVEDVTAVNKAPKLFVEATLFAESLAWRFPHEGSGLGHASPFASTSLIPATEKWSRL